MCRVKSFILISLVLVLLSPFANAAVQEKTCIILTSPSNHSTMTLVSNDSFVAGMALVDNKTQKYKGFAAAYKEFDSACKRYVQQKCNKDHLKGVVNYKINFVISDKMYYFAAQFDYFK